MSRQRFESTVGSSFGEMEHSSSFLTANYMPENSSPERVSQLSYRGSVRESVRSYVECDRPTGQSCSSLRHKRDSLPVPFDDKPYNRRKVSRSSLQSGTVNDDVRSFVNPTLRTVSIKFSILSESMSRIAVYIHVRFYSLAFAVISTIETHLSKPRQSI